jgi:signal transduction histidine kinase
LAGLLIVAVACFDLVADTPLSHAAFASEMRRLPLASQVVARPPTVWDRYRWQIAGGVALIVGQFALIAGLLVQRKRRIAAQNRLAERLRFERLVGEIGTALTVASTGDLDDQIRRCLQHAATTLGVDRGTLWQSIAGGTALELSHFWTSDGAPPPLVFLDLRELGYFRERYSLHDGIVRFSSRRDLPAQAEAERTLAEASGVRSLASVPLYAGGTRRGVLAFVAVRRECPWPSEFLEQFTTLAEHFANALLRAESAAALKSSTALTEAVLAAMPGETAIVDPSGHIIQVNEAWRRAASGATEGFGMPLPMIDMLSAIGMPRGAAAEVEADVASVLRGDRDQANVEYAALRGGADYWFDMRIRRLRRRDGGAALMNFDVTARRRAEAEVQRQLAQIAHLDRVAGMGHLASSIAHELNQPLTAILTNAQTAQRVLASDVPNLDVLSGCLADIVSDDRRAAEVIRGMRRFLRTTKLEALPLSLNDLVVTTIGLVWNEARVHDVRIDLVPAPSLPVIRGDLVQIQQVILNVLTNAITAAAAGAYEHVVRVATRPTAGGVELIVADSGPGIPEADRARIFQAFYTTRPDGLGMGLAISRKIVDAHGGRLEVVDKPGPGATFRMELPIDPLPSGD